jgi:hypothetical protein
MRKTGWLMTFDFWLMHRFNKIVVTIVFTLLCRVAFAQDVKVNSGFLEDSLKIGQQARFYLSAKYPSNLTVLFPDSTFSFLPFEYEGKRYFPTKTESGVSVDSTVFYFTTFEVDRVQFLQLPVFVIQPKDCTVYQSQRDSILITQLVAKVPDSLAVDKLPLKMNTAYQKVFFEFNTWVLIIAVGLLIVIGIVVWIIFGKRIMRYFRAKRLNRKHAEFRTAYEKIVAELQKRFSPDLAESALSTWKKYMEQLEARPYTKLTTRETLHLIPDERLGQNLKEIDRAIYGHQTAVVPSFQTLQAFADERFTKKLEEVKHG